VLYAVPVIPRRVGGQIERYLDTAQRLTYA
jgi:hypothetical protein